MTRKTGEQRLDALRAKAALKASAQLQGENAGQSLVGMMEAELVRQCILYLRHKEWLRTGRGKPVEHVELLRGEIIGLSKAVLIVRLPYQRGDDEQRKRIVGKALREAKATEAQMAKRRTEAKTREFRVSDLGSLVTDMADIADKQVRDLGDMLMGEGNHKGHKARQVGRCVICECGVRAQGRLKK